MEPAGRDERIGSVVDGRYRILEALAEGSMGVVYRGERVPVGKQVAVKFLHAAFASDAEFLSRFERETRVMSKLAHPHCVSVVDFGVAAGAPYLVMDFVAGTTLRAMLDDGPLPAGRALALMRQLLAGLAHAHAQGIVHRDIKPANLMISDEIGTGDHLRILDFGLARLRGAMSQTATQAQIVVGTPSYMAPEQTVGGAVDARADVYAAGVVLFEMLTGQKPFTAEDTLDLLGMHRGAPIPRLDNLAPPGAVIPAGVQAIVDRAMAKDAAARYQTAIEFADAIDAVLGVEGTGPRRRATSPAARGTGPVAREAADAPAATEAPDAIDATEVSAPGAMAGDGGGPGARGGASRAAAPHASPITRVAQVVAIAGAAAAVAWYVVVRRPDDARRAAEAAREGREVAAAERARTAGASGAKAGEPHAAAGAAASGVPAPAIAPTAANDANEAVALAPLDAGAAADGPAPAALDAGAAPTGPAAAGDDSEPADPAAAGDLDPAAVAAGSGSGSAADDEAADAPATPEAAAARAPAAPALATTVGGAVQMIKDGKRDLALASLRALARDNPRSAYLPFLLGNLYFDQRWWSVAMDDYRAAIGKNGAYRSNPTLIRNVIRTLASSKTSGKAIYFLRKTIGRPALPYLRAAAAHDPNAAVRKHAAALARVMR